MPVRLPLLWAGLRYGIPARCFVPRAHQRWMSSAGDSIEACALVHSKYGEPESVLELNTHRIPSTPPQNSLILRALASPINPADVNTVQGTYGRLPRMVNKPFGPDIEGVEQPSVVPGNEGAFEVIATGTDVPSTDFQVGDWVIPMSPGFGTWRTHVVVPHSSSGLWKIPSRLRGKGLSPVQAAMVAVNPLTALRLISDFGTRFEEGEEQRGLREGDWLVQNGANSAVGRLVIQLAKIKGFKTLNVIRQRQDEYATEPLRQELLGLGADVVVTDSQLGKQLSEMLKRVSGGKGASLMLDCVGGKAAAQLSRSLNEGAEIVTYGAMSKQPMALGAGMMIFKDIRFRGFWVSRWGERFPEAKREALETLLGLIADGKVDTGRFESVTWNKETVDRAGRKALVDPVQLTLTGFKSGKSVFVFQ